MAQRIVLELDVESGDLDQLNKDLDKTQKNLRETEGESKKASKGLKDVGDNGGAIAVLDSLTGGLATRVRDAAEASKLFNFSLKGMRTALVATGIGAFVVALGLVVGYWDEIKQFVTGVNAELEKTIQLQQRQIADQEHILGLLDGSDEILKQQGKSQKEINDLKIKEIEALIEIQKAELENQRIRLENLNQLKSEGGGTLRQFATFAQKIVVGFVKAIDDIFSTIGIDLGVQEKTASLTNSVLESIFGTEEDINEAESNISELELKLRGLQNRLAGLQNQNAEIDRGDGVERGEVESVGGLTPEQTNELTVLGMYYDERLKANQEYNDALFKAELEEAGKRVRIAKMENQQKLEVTADTLGKVSQLFGETSTAGKIAGSAQALINTYLGVTSVLSNPTTIPEPFGTIAKIASAATVLASGLKAVKQINSVKTLGGGAGVSAGGGGAVLSQPATPSFNVVGNTGINQIGQAIGENNNEATRAYVVFDDVKKAEDIENQSVREAQF